MSAEMMSIPREMLAYIRRTVPSGSFVVELGSGLGTAELCKDYVVWTVEHDPAWLGRTLANYIHAPLVKGWYDPAVLLEKLPALYDIVIVDGPIEDRSGLLRHLSLFRRGAPMLFDDLNRPANLKVWEGVARDRGVPGRLFRKTVTGKWWGMVEGVKT